MADILNIAGRVHSISEDGVVTTTDEIFDSEQDRKQSVINSEVAQDTQDVANLKNRMTAVEALGEISVGGGDVQIANNAADIEAGSGKVPTVNAIDGALQGIGFFECTTVAGTAAKTISATGYALRSGGSIKVKMTYKNTAASSVTLNINSTGAKALLYKGKPVDSGNTWGAGEVVEIYYDPTYNNNSGCYFANNVAGGSGDGVFDISVYNSGQQYIDLTAAIGVNAAHVPTNVRVGGMSVKYLGTDDKYHQYRYTLDYEDTQAGIKDFAEVGNWVSVEDELALAGVYDVSAHNGGAYFADLSALLSDANLSTLIPASVRRGGMSIKFIQGTEQSSDNKYVQARCMAQNFTTDVTQWQGVDETPTTGSKNLVESGGVFSSIDKICSSRNINGNNNNLVYSSKINVKSGHTYRLWVLNPDVSMEGVSSGYRFIVNTSQSTQSPLLEIVVGTALAKFYDIYVDGDSLYVGAKCASGSSLKIEVVDITDLDGTLINVSESGENYTTVADARNSVYATLRKRGLVLTYQLNGSWVVEQYISSYPTQPSWATDDSYWIKLSKEGEDAVCNINSLVSDIVRTPVEARNAVPVPYRKKGLIIIFKSSNGWSIEQFIGESWSNQNVYWLSFSDETQKKINAHTIGIGEIVGIDPTQLAFSNNIQVVGGRRYKFHISDKSLITGTTGIIFYVGSEPTTTSGDIYVLYSTPSKDDYVFKIPNGVSNVYVAAKCNSGSILKIYVEEYKTEEDIIYIAANNSSYSDRTFADVVCPSDVSSTINNYLTTPGVHIKLLEGTYNGSGYLYPRANNITIEGVGNVTINRSSGNYSYILSSQSNVIDGLTIRNITFEDKKVVSLTNITSIELFNTRSMIESTAGSSYTLWNHLKLKFPNQKTIIKLGLGQSFDTDSLVACKRVLGDTSMISYSPTIELYGKITLTDTHDWTFPISLIGMTDDAEIEVNKDGSGDGVSFSSNGNIEVKNIHFTRSGSSTAKDYPCVNVTGNHTKFYDCVFEHKGTSPSSYTPSEDTGNTVLDGDRLHGCYITCSEYDDKCDTEFHNCKAIGSPYGHKNVRGFYISGGSPKLYNCIGIGGGIGKLGHGIINHRYSKAYLYDCIGIGSPNGYSECCGFRFQAVSTSKLYNCIGFGSRGEQYISNGGTDIVKQNIPTSSSHGFSATMESAPTLISCVGYAGDGANSYAIHAGDNAKPIINGGFYGKDKQSIGKTYSGTQITFDVDNNNKTCNIIKLYRNLTTAITDGHYLLKSGNDTLASGELTTGDSVLSVQNVVIPANTTVTFSVVDSNGEPISNVPAFGIILVYEVENTMCSVGVGQTASPKITNATLTGNNISDGANIGVSADCKISFCSIILSSDKLSDAEEIMGNNNVYWEK